MQYQRPRGAPPNNFVSVLDGGDEGYRDVPLGPAYVAPKARDSAVAARLFEVSATLTGVPFPDLAKPAT